MNDKERISPIQSQEPAGNETVEIGPEQVRRPPASGRLLPVLLVLSEAPPNDIHIIDKKEFKIGRLDTCDLCLGDAHVSREHAIIQYENINQMDRPPSAVLYDSKSRNGVFLNGRKIDGFSPLKNGDRIVIGETPIGFYHRTELEIESDQRVRNVLVERGYVKSAERIVIEMVVTLRILFPENTFNPLIICGLAKDLSLQGMRISTRDITKDMYSQILKGPHYAKVIGQLPESQEEIALHGRIAWIDFNSHLSPPATTLGIQFESLLEPAEAALKRIFKDRA